MTDMQHLSGDELVDLVEGIVSDAEVPHLASCECCRDQLAGLRAARAMALQDEVVEVPEPSPLFWDYFSARVREAVANEPAPPDGWSQRFRSWPGVLAPVCGVVAVVVAVAVMFEAPAPAPPRVAPSSAADVAPRYAVELLGDSVTADDASLAIVANLTDSIGLDAAAEAGLTSDDSAEHAVTHMSAAELQQLERLLTEEMSRKGA